MPKRYRGRRAGAAASRAVRGDARRRHRRAAQARRGLPARPARAHARRGRSLPRGRRAAVELPERAGRRSAGLADRRRVRAGVRARESSANPRSACCRAWCAAASACTSSKCWRASRARCRPTRRCGRRCGRRSSARPTRPRCGSTATARGARPARGRRPRRRQHAAGAVGRHGPADARRTARAAAALQERRVSAVPRAVPVARRRRPATADAVHRLQRFAHRARTCSPAPGRANCSSCATSARSSRRTTSRTASTAPPPRSSSRC